MHVAAEANVKDLPWPLAPAARFARLVPELVPPAPSRHCGPIDESNWAIPKVILAGACPLSDAKVQRLMEAGGVTHMVCLMEEQEHREEEQEQASRPTLSLPPSLQILSLPTPDKSVATDEAVKGLINDILVRLTDSTLPAPPVMYIHCWGGHGRTGTIVALLLGIMYDVSADDALALCNAYHAQRRYPGRRQWTSPQTSSQYAQVRRLLKTQWWKSSCL